jgi:hypothetical protein
MTPQTMILLSAAAVEMGLSSRRVAQMADTAGYQLRLGKFRYLTPEQFEALKQAHAGLRPYLKSKGEK